MTISVIMMLNIMAIAPRLLGYAKTLRP